MMSIQLAVEAVLVLLLLVILRRTRAAGSGETARMPENMQNSIEKFLTESEKIAATFERNLKDKKNLSADLILKLDRRLSDYQLLLKKTETSLNSACKKLADLKSAPEVPPGPAAVSGKANPAAPEVRALVLQMAKKGHSPEEIAAKARLHLGEVELIIDLESQFNI
jgi:hypothetical protein